MRYISNANKPLYLTAPLILTKAMRSYKFYLNSDEFLILKGTVGLNAELPQLRNKLHLFLLPIRFLEGIKARFLLFDLSLQESFKLT